MSNYSFPKNISYAEMTHSDTAYVKHIDNTPNKEQRDNLFSTALFLQKLRDKLSAYYGKDMPIKITSGFRSLDVNRAIGSKDTSAHVKGFAADIRVRGMSGFELATFIDENMQGERFDQVINEFNSWVHVGIGPKLRMQTLTAIKQGFGTAYVRGLSQS